MEETKPFGYWEKEDNYWINLFNKNVKLIKPLLIIPKKKKPSGIDIKYAVSKMTQHQKENLIDYR